MEKIVGKIMIPDELDLQGKYSGDLKFMNLNLKAYLAQSNENTTEDKKQFAKVFNNQSISLYIVGIPNDDKKTFTIAAINQDNKKQYYSLNFVSSAHTLLKVTGIERIRIENVPDDVKKFADELGAQSNAPKPNQ